MFAKRKPLHKGERFQEKLQGAKRLIAFLTAAALLLTLASCGGGPAGSPQTAGSGSAPSERNAGAESSQAPSAQGQGEDGVQVEKGAFDVSITVPAEYAVGETQEDLDSKVADGIYTSAVLEEDGSVSLKMSKRQHAELLDGLSSSINTSLQDMIGSEDYPNITDIKSNSNFTEFTITTKNKSLDLNESMATMLFYMYGGLYNAFSGSGQDDVSVKFVNETTGKVIKEMNSADEE